MNEEFLANLKKYNHVYPPFNKDKDSINSSIKNNENFIDGMEFIGSFLSPERDSPPVNKFAYLSSWNESQTRIATAVYLEVSASHGISEGQLCKVINEEK